MSSNPTAATQRAERVRRLRADMETVLDTQRQRPLPAWLSSRRNRRTLALLPIPLLAGGLFAGTVRHGLLQGVLILALVWASAAIMVLLRRATRLLDAMPDRLLDEREIGERDDASRRAYRLVTALLLLLMALAGLDYLVTNTVDHQLVRGDGWFVILMSASLVATMVPSAVTAWRSPDPIDDDDDV